MSLSRYTVQVPGRPPWTINSVAVKTGMEAMRLLLSLVRQGRDSKASCTKGERPGHSWSSPEMTAGPLFSLTTVSLTLGQTIHPFCRGEEVTGRLVSGSLGLLGCSCVYCLFVCMCIFECVCVWCVCVVCVCVFLFSLQ